MTSEQVLFARDPAEAPETSASSIQADGPPSRFQRYLAEIHLLLVVVLVILSVIIGAIGFALRPGTDEPPAVSNANLTFYVYEQKSPSAIPNDPTRVDVDEIMMQETSSIVLMQIDLFATFPKAGAGHWELGTSILQSQPYPCPDPYTYLGTAQPDPVSISNAQFTIGNHPVNRVGIANFVGHRSTKTAANVLWIVRPISRSSPDWQSCTNRRNRSVLGAQPTHGIRRRVCISCPTSCGSRLRNHRHGPSYRSDAQPLFREHPPATSTDYS